MIDVLVTAVAGLSGLGAVAYGATHYTVWRPTRPDAWPRILMYHSIQPGRKGRGGVTSTKALDWQLGYLKRQGYRFVLMSELADSEPACLPQKTVALTFDDGFRDNVTYLFPLLEAHDARATVYLAPDMEGIDRLRPEDIRTMQASGRVEFGAHTLHHVNLTRCTEAEAWEEITASKARVETLTGAPCRSFAYPYGRYAPEHVAMARAAGFTTAVTTKKAIRPLTENRLELPRISMVGEMNRLQCMIALKKGRYRV